ncbi:hypothetical protein [Aliarcobacter butzleri]|uniref:hypothetical protein n=1 Tax=Aliarcobacter butzleri TaxID=28197 RepID=UPI001868CA60|nr:hypothetical protein [Aliarcobacter butzleri]
MIRLGFGEMYDNISYGKVQNVLFNWLQEASQTADKLQFTYFLAENMRVTSLKSVNFE